MLQVNAEYFGSVVQYASKLLELVLVLLKHLDTRVMFFLVLLQILNLLFQ